METSVSSCHGEIFMLLTWDGTQNEPFQRKSLQFGIHEGIPSTYCNPHNSRGAEFERNLCL